MHRYRPALALLLTSLLLHLASSTAVASPGDIGGGELRIVGADGKTAGVCPLQHTDVKAEVGAHTSRVRVRQIFTNPTDRKIEAVYGFPLPQDCAVDDMTMIVGDRRIRGLVKPREQARQIYEAARQAGHVASLLDQERPNIFTQAVANIEPGARVEIEIAYVQTLHFQDGWYEWVFPTVVGPRYIPGAPAAGGGTTQVPDAARITPPYSIPPTRAGHDISLAVHLDGGMPVREIACPSHEIAVQKDGGNRATVTLAEKATLPNKDFILRYRTAHDDISDAMLAHTDPRGTFFTLVVQPPRRVEEKRIVPREMVFVIDCSGSQMGFPIEKSKEAMRLCILQMHAADTFNLISFAGGTGRCFPHPVPNTRANREKALRYLSELAGSGGTEMLPAMLEAMGEAPPSDRLRVVCFMTDGYVGNDFEIIAAVQKRASVARVFSFGIGQAVNRYLLDAIAEAGRGAVEYVTLESHADEAARRFHERVQSPVLTDVRIDWGGLKVRDVYPRQIPDLFSERPIVLYGRIDGTPAGAITLRGGTANGPFERMVRVAPADGANDALATLWARARVDHLVRQDLQGAQNGAMRDDLKRQITSLGVEYRLMTQFTSFVAVEERSVTRGGEPQRVDVPVELPEGVNPKGIFGNAGALAAQGGDPLLAVSAPKSCRQVVAIMPDGAIQRLAWSARSKRWEARFDIPTHEPEGFYSVVVVVVRQDGTRSRLILRYAVDQTKPRGVAVARVVDLGGQRSLRLEVETSEDTSRAVAFLPWGRGVSMRPSASREAVFEATVPVPPDFAASAWHEVTVVLTDRAHNRTAITVDCSDLTAGGTR